ncbi:MAG TPA: ATP-binding protein [Spirochaetota bacterium]|nr:ATP-binding protein [Spirochaetota bacterium]HOS38179.1 ATP-binding protein [Spirochaetota bacterium]HPU87324.1 ATP-binding protein [Spirochaetota bacterium]
MNFYILIPLAFFTINLCLVVYIAAKSGKKLAARAFMLFAVMLALWELSEFFLWSNLPDATLIGIYRATGILYMLPGVLFLNFAYSLLGKKRDAVFHGFSACMFAGTILAFASDWYFPDRIIRHGWGNAAAPGPLMYPIIIVAIVLPGLYGIALIAAAMRTQRDPLRVRQFGTVLAGFAAATAAAVLTNVVLPLFADAAAIPHLASSLAGIGSISMFIAIARYRLLAPGLGDAAVEIFSRVHDCVFVVGSDGRVLEMNEAAARAFPQAGPDAGAPGLAALYGELTCVHDECRDRETTLSLGGESRTYLVSQSPIGGSGESPATLVVMKDITEMRRMEAELSRSSRIESLGVFAGGIAHDFNNLLTVILGNIALVRQSIQRDPEALRMLAQAETASIRAADLTRQLLTFSKGGDPVKRITSLPALVRETMQFALSGSSVRCAYDFAEDLLNAEIDANQIGQVIHNIAINALQAMPRGGAITVGAHNCGDDGGGAIGPHVRLTFADTGCGIPAGIIERIFDPFFTTREMGTGLGLSIAYSIVTKHGGRICVSSRPGDGTMFEVYLPATDARVVARCEDAIPAPGRPLKILVVDDEPQVRDIASRILSALGHRAACVGSIDDAVTAFSAAHARGERFDCVITDLTIPGGAGGTEVFRLLREIDRNVTILISSGYSNDPILAEHARHGFAGIIPKPYRIEDVRNALLRINDEPPAPDDGLSRVN